MSEVLEKSVKEKAKKEVVRDKKPVRKKYRLIDFFGCLQGQIFGDDAVFNLGVKV